jgi:ubiquinone/menaquinone biosynthesis C-methylase UbiE
MIARPYVIVAICALLTIASVVAWHFAIFIVPIQWTGEPVRIADLLGLKPGSVVANIGAGDGDLAVEMAHVVGARGIVYATELSTQRRGNIARRASEAGTPQVRIVEAKTDITQLPDECCDAVYMRASLHHISDLQAYAREVVKAVRPGGRVAIIDFAPGALWFHGDEHGIEADNVIQAFHQVGMSLTQRIEDWGGATYLLLFERRATGHTPS